MPGDPMAQAMPGTSAPRVQVFLTKRPWDEEDLTRQRVAKMMAAATRGAGVLVFDEIGFPTPGTAAVGVARQYSGTLGQVGHCQVAVTCCETDPQATWPVAVRLYLSHAWAQALLDQARAWGCRIAVWWPMPTTGITRMSWRAWKPGRNRLWWWCAPTSRCGCGRRRPGGCGGRMRGSRRGPAGRGAPFAGGRAPQGGCARNLWPCGAGG
jgi:DDE superfamily endonuclease